MTRASLLPRAAALSAAFVLLSSASARAAADSESTPVHLSDAGAQGAHVSGNGGSIVRTIVGLAVVIGVIYGVAWVLKQVKAGKQERSTGAGLATIASLPLGPNRSVHLVRAGRELVLVGVAEHAITPLRTYDEAQARAAGLIDGDGALLLPTVEAAPARERKRLALPKPRLALPAPRPRPQIASGQGVLDTLRSMTVRR
jgi:flagellar protein FliO/FliZ